MLQRTAKHRTRQGKKSFPQASPENTFYHPQEIHEQVATAWGLLGSCTWGLHKVLLQEDPIMSEAQYKRRLKDIAPVVRQFKSAGVPRKRLLRILAQHLSPIDKPSIDHLGLMNKRLLKKITDEITMRRILQHYVLRVTKPPLPDSLKKQLLEDCAHALKKLARVRKGVKTAGCILKDAGAADWNKRKRKRGKKRDPSARQAEKELMESLVNARSTVAAASKLTYELLARWEPMRVAESADSIRKRFLLRA